MDSMNSTEIIHLILGKANPERMNGVNKVVFQLASKQAEAGKKVSVWGITKDPVKNYGDRAFDTQLFQALRNPFAIHPRLRDALIAQKGKAVVHLHGGWIPVYASISRLLKQYQIPFVITPHGAYNTIAMQRSKWMKKIHFHLFEKSILQRASHVHCIGESEVEGTQKLYPLVNTFLLPYGYTIPANMPIAKQEVKEQFVIGFVGRIDIHTKGLDILLDAFDQLVKMESNSILWIVGGGEVEKLTHMITAKNLTNKVVLWGSKFGAEKDELMSRMDVFAHPSRNEGLPAAILEASAMGIPSVVTRATNVGPFIKNYNCGITVANENAMELAKALDNLYLIHLNKGLTEIGERAKKMVQTEFNWDMLVHRFDALYQK
jgi:glycosyltransferase involved in cell wall biosynthesis